MSYGEFYTEMVPHPEGGWTHKLTLDFPGHAVDYIGDGPYEILNDTPQVPNQALVGVTGTEAELDAIAATLGLTEVIAARVA